MRSTILAVLLLALSSCSDRNDDDEPLGKITSDADASVASVKQAVFISTMPELLLIVPVPTPTSGLSWTAYSVVWGVQSYDPATTLTSYVPGSGQSPEIGFSAYATGPGVPTCTRIGSTHSFNCNGVTVPCPSASFLTLPAQWRIGGPVQPWRLWSDSGSENWLRASAWGAAPTSSNVQRINDRSVIFCYHDRAGRTYQLRHR